jgi:hypothetical protein
MACAQVADGGTVSNMEGSLEYTDLTADKGVAIQLRVLIMCKQLLTIKTYHVMKYKLVPQTWIDPLV